MKRKLKQLFLFLVVVGLLGAAGYVASVLNSRRYFIVVGPAKVNIERGRMLPYGHEPFVPKDPTIRKAYASFSLPGGMKVGRGTSTYDDRVELDQALFRLLRDAARVAVDVDNERTPTLLPRYIEQMAAIPGVSSEQQIELRSLERDAAYVRARHAAEEGRERLVEAARLFKEASRGTSGRFPDAEARALRIHRLLDRLARVDPRVETVATSSTSTAATR